VTKEETEAACQIIDYYFGDDDVASTIDAAELLVMYIAWCRETDNQP
jgi:hypothetical protein